MVALWKSRNSSSNRPSPDSTGGRSGQVRDQKPRGFCVYPESLEPAKSMSGSCQRLERRITSLLIPYSPRSNRIAISLHTMSVSAPVFDKSDPKSDK